MLTNKTADAAYLPIMKGKAISNLLFIVIGFLFYLGATACNAQASKETATTIPFTKTPQPITTPTPKMTPTFRASLTLRPTADKTWEIWHATAAAIETAEWKAERTASAKWWGEKETQVAQFSTPCEDMNFYASKVSPDGKWFAASCDEIGDSTLTVQNKGETKWILHFNEFLSPESPEGIWGRIYPILWSSEGRYLYFTISLGYDGGGNYCFPKERGMYGLFCLNLSNGSWATVIPFTDSFPGYEIRFSPTGQRFAISLNGVTITDLQSGQSTNMAIDGRVEKISWSPDGKQLAYSVGNCDDEKIISSTVYIWDATTGQAQILLEMDGMILIPELWVDESTLRIIGEEIRGLKSFYTLYEYEIESQNILFAGTATPRP